MHEANVPGEEHKLLLRDLGQAAKTLLDVGAAIPYSMVMLRLALQREALARCKGNRQRAAAMLGVHRNTFTRNLPPDERRARERFQKRPPRTVPIYKYAPLEANSKPKGGLSIGR